MKKQRNQNYFIEILVVLICTIFSQNILIAQDEVVTTSNGRKVILHADKTWEYYENISYNFDFSILENNQIPDFLRQGITVDKQTLRIAVEMNLQGWEYIMPQPKSAQAEWGNYDGRTTWWNGYWYNYKTETYSRETPQKRSNGYYYGDEQNDKDYWRNGGSPDSPTKLEWLLSTSGGVKPY
jgi:hypothetical protein